MRGNRMKKLKIVGYMDANTTIYLVKPKKGKYLKLVIDLDPIDIKSQLDKIVRGNEKATTKK